MIKIIDLSYHEKPANIDYATVANQVQGVILRAAYSVGKDTAFDTHYQGFARHGVPIGAFHFLVEYKPAEEQADAMAAAIVGKQLRLGLWADVELEKDKPRLTKRTVDRYLQHAEQSLGEFGIYSSRYYWDLIMATNQYKSRQLWVAHYYAAAPLLPVTGGWTKYRLWQQTDRAQIPGISGGVDLSYFGGSVEEYNQWAGTGYTAPAPSEPMYQVEVVYCNALNVRRGAGTQYERVGLLYNGDRVDVYQESQGWLHIINGGLDGWISAAYTMRVEVEPPAPVYTLEQKVDILWAAHPELH